MSLRDFASLERAPKLEEFVIQKADAHCPEDFVPVLRNRALKRAGFGFHKKDDVRRMTELCEVHRVDGTESRPKGFRRQCGRRRNAGYG